MLYAHKRYTVSVVELQEDVILETFGGSQFGSKGDYLATDQCGNKFIIEREIYFRDYVEVEKPKIDKLALARGYIEMGAINLEEAEAGKYTYNEGWGSGKPF